jgi:hypothetical protein
LKRLVAALLAAAALSVAAAANADPLRYGVADDWPKFHPCGDIWWQSANDIGYHDLRMTVQWDGSQTIPAQAEIQAVVDCALLNNTRPILAVYPARPSLIGSDDGAQNAFASFVAKVGLTFPSVTNIVVGNEPNVNRFWQPQYTGGQDAAGRDYEHTLAKSYDALKGVRPNVTVWGPATSSRGNDNANAASNPSHSPVWFIKDMGDAYKASGRTKPIFDEFDMHPYPPIQDTDPYSKAFQWPQAGAANLDRIKQALWDAFHGTGQPVVTEQPGGKVTQFQAPQSLPMNLDEVGSQTVVTGHDGAYSDAPESISPISQDLQAQYHTQLMEIAACDPAVRALLFFDLIDETDLHSGFQSGNLFADLAHKQSYAAVKNKIASTHGDCQGGVAGITQAWAHTEQVVGPLAFFGGGGAGSQPASQPLNHQYWAFNVTASEDATYKAGLLRVGPGGASVGAASRTLASAKRGATVVSSANGLVRAYYKPLVKFSVQFLPAGYYAYAITLMASVNPQRSTTLVSKAFKVGKPKGSGGPSIGAGKKGKGKGNGKGKARRS